MADLNLITYYEGSLDYSIAIDSSAAGQPGVLVTITNGLGEEETIIVDDALVLFTPVLEWLTTDELVIDVSRKSGVDLITTQSVLQSLALVGRARTKEVQL